MLSESKTAWRIYLDPNTKKQRLTKCSRGDSSTWNTAKRRRRVCQEMFVHSVATTWHASIHKICKRCFSEAMVVGKYRNIKKPEGISAAKKQRVNECSLCRIKKDEQFLREN